MRGMGARHSGQKSCEIAAKLLVSDNCTDLNMVGDIEGDEQLMRAVNQGHALLMSDACTDPNIKSYYQGSPLMLAVKMNHAECAKLL